MILFYMKETLVLSVGIVELDNEFLPQFLDQLNILVIYLLTHTGLQIYGMYESYFVCILEEKI